MNIPETRASIFNATMGAVRRQMPDWTIEEDSINSLSPIEIDEPIFDPIHDAWIILFAREEREP